MSYRTRGQSSGRVIAADGALLITDNDGVGSGTILVSSTTGTKTATFSWNAPADSLGGAQFTIFCTARSGGQYDIACTYLGSAGTVTIDAALERPVFHRIGSTLHCIGLGGATFA